MCHFEDADAPCTSLQRFFTSASSLFAFCRIAHRSRRYTAAAGLARFTRPAAASRSSLPREASLWLQRALQLAAIDGTFVALAEVF